MSNNRTQSTTNTRSGSNSGNLATTTAAVIKTASITYKSDEKSHIKITTTSKTLPEKLKLAAPPMVKIISNDNNKTMAVTIVKSTSQETLTEEAQRRNNFNLGGQKDEQKLHYGKPQMIIKTAKLQNDNVDNASGTSLGSNQDDQNTTLVYYDGKLTSASLNTLIQHMVPTHDYYPDHNYIFSLLLSARLFIRPHELLAQISETWEEQQQQKQHVICVDFVDDAKQGHCNPTISSSPLVLQKISDASIESNKQMRTPTQKSAQNCIRLLSEWIETFPYDFRDERLMQQVRILARKCVYIDNSLGKQVSRILQLLVARLTSLEHYEVFLQSLLSTESSCAANHLQYLPLHNTSASISSYYGSYCNNLNNTESYKNAPTSVSLNQNSNSYTTGLTTHSDELIGIMHICGSCAQLAHQLTAIELERLSYIGPEEFVQTFAKEYHHSFCTLVGAGDTVSNTMPSSLNDIKKTHNLESYVEWFNRLSYLTGSEIVKYSKKKQRVRIIEYWIETARECFNIGNFNSLMAIIAGLNLAPISRMKKTWSKVQSAKFSVLEHQMDPTSNFNSYRSTLKAAMWRSEGATNERERIVIPFFSLFVKDLYFLNEGCSNRLPNNHINFEKCSQLAQQVMEFNKWKKVSCPFERLPNVIAYLQHNPVLNENALSMASFECEPPENTEERGQYKTFKAETKQQLLQQLQEQHQQNQP